MTFRNMDGNQNASDLKAAIDQARSLAREQVAAVYQLHIDRVREELESGWRERLDEIFEERFIDVVLKHPSVRSIRDVKTRELTPEAYILKAEITFDNDYVADVVNRSSLDKISFDGPKRDHAMRRMTALVTDLIATEIAALEKEIRAVIPQAKHIDIEVAHPDVIPTDEEDEMLA